MLILAIILFFTGILENFIASINTIFLVQKKKIGCFITSIIMAITWCYIVGAVTDNLTKIGLIITYAIGFGTGEVFALNAEVYMKKIAKKYGRSFNIKKKKRVKK